MASSIFSETWQSYQEVAIGVWHLLAPALSAVFGAWLGYFFGGKRKLQELLVSDRVERIKKLGDAVIELQHFCEVQMSMAYGSDVGRSEDQLPKDAPRSFMDHGQNLEQVMRGTMFYLSRKATAEMRSLINSVWQTAQSNFRDVANPELGIRMTEKYAELSAQADSCVPMLRREAGFRSK